ncbi:hypothetical protein, partial [Acinetobacter baumannii]|uniref:hypothetical protein n=1 Tax=Acinetobacter baumannii TaxID=470 RepID=UPI001CB7B9CB
PLQEDSGSQYSKTFHQEYCVVSLHCLAFYFCIFFLENSLKENQKKLRLKTEALWELPQNYN